MEADLAITPSPESKKLSMRDKVIYASGNLPGNFFGSFTGQIQNFYVWWMGLGAIYILIGQILYGIWNVLNDPVFGYLQDKTKSKDGRYIPWIKWFAPLFTTAFVLMFLVPSSWRKAVDPNLDYQLPLFFWYVLTLMFYDMFYTIVYLAHVALLPQMTMDTGERTQISLITTIIGLFGTAISGVLPLMFITNPTTDSIKNFQILVIIFGIASLIPWYFIVHYIKEKQEYIPETDTSFMDGIKCVLKNPSGRIYIVYDGISVGLNTALMTAIVPIFSWVFGINSYFLQDHPDWGYMSIILYLLPVALGFLIGFFIEMRIPKTRDVKSALMYSMTMEAIGFFIAYLSIALSSNMTFGEYVLPSGLWGVSIGIAIVGMGFSGDFIYHNVMRADTIDYDEFLTGERREAVYAGVGCLLSKLMNSVSLSVIPLVILYAGLDASTAADNTTHATVARLGFASAVNGVALAAFLFPSILAIVGIIFWKFYPLDKKRLAEVRVVLDQMHAKKRTERLSSDGKSKFVK